MATPDPVCMMFAAKYTSGVGTMPTSSVSTPPSCMPSCKASDSISLLRRPSRPTTRVCTPSSRARAASATPKARANVASIRSGTVPRMS
ncbi:hypothetical protein D3C78_1461670 [compost metagenome]